ncbi:MAG: hypothetical protein ABH811_02790 [archaeon]
MPKRLSKDIINGVREKGIYQKRWEYYTNSGSLIEKISEIPFFGAFIQEKFYSKKTGERVKLF